MQNFEWPQIPTEHCHANIGEILSSVVAQMDHRAQSGSGALPLTGVPTGFPELDQLTFGLQPGELIVMAGRPGSGRYALALKIVDHIAGSLGLPVVFHSLTCAVEEVGLRLLAVTSGVDSYRMRTGQLEEADWQKISASLASFHEYPLAIESLRHRDFEYCVARTRTYLKSSSRSPGLILIDDFQSFSFAGKACSLDEARQVALYSLRQLAGELGAPVLILSQLDARIDRRPDPVPGLGDLPRSGSIEGVADTILLLHRDGEYPGSNTLPDFSVINIHQAKSRWDCPGRCRITLTDAAMPVSHYWGADTP